MEQCTVETGLLRKKPCGQAAVTHCTNCEQALCAKHAVPEFTESGKKSGKFMCKDCYEARREYAKTLGALPQSEKPAAAPAKDTAPPKPAAAAKEAPAAPKPADDGGIDFTPSKDKK